ncbi:hypothetical protein M23134_07441 [Microscilla marina ATCC 23134]|uniref:Uncharacterized protein n=1 Tax=Microscilla marina ATCC 23134 TaxID=313606 RepID=A1ZET2_MICM2|nr:hypothetical protein M23134_07441 [Microscilla marina ATCC 23134]
MFYKPVTQTWKGRVAGFLLYHYLQNKHKTQIPVYQLLTRLLLFVFIIKNSFVYKVKSLEIWRGLRAKKSTLAIKNNSVLTRKYYDLGVLPL